MKMKKFYIFLVLLLVLPSALSLDKKLYSGWVKAGEPFLVGNETFLVNYILDNNASIIMLPEGISAVIYASSMNCTSEWLYTICQEKQKFQVKGNDVPPDVRSNSLDVSLFIKINKTDAGIELNKDFNQSLIFLGDVIYIKMSMDKVGQPSVYNLSFADSFLGFVVESFGSSCTSSRDIINFDAKKLDKKIVCIYRLIPQKAGVFNNTAVLSYVVLDKAITKKYNQKITVSEYPITLKLNYTRGIKVAQNFKVNISLNKSKDSEIKELRVYLPLHLSVINKSPEFTSDQKSLYITFPKNTTYFILLQSLFSGNFTANLSIIYEHNKVSSEIKKGFLLEILPSLPEFKIFKTQEGSVLRVSNTENISFKNIKMFANDMEFDLPLLEKSKYKEFDLNEDNNMTHISASFSSQFGQEYSESYLLGYSAKEELTKNSSAVGDVDNDKKDDLSVPIKISMNTWIIACIAACLLLIFLFIRLRPKESQLDRDIREIKKNNNFK